MSEFKIETKPKLKARAPRAKSKIRIIMQRYYKPIDKGLEAQLDGLGRLPKGEMVEVPKKLGEQLIASGIANAAGATGA